MDNLSFHRDLKVQDDHITRAVKKYKQDRVRSPANRLFLSAEIVAAANQRKADLKAQAEAKKAHTEAKKADAVAKAAMKKEAARKKQAEKEKKAQEKSRE